MSRRTIAAAFLAASFHVPAMAQIAPAPTIQQQFDAASAALDRQAWSEALRQYEALEGRELG